MHTANKELQVFSSTPLDPATDALPTSGPHTDFPDVCVHELFERQTAQRPDAIAVICGDERLTYRQLNERANQLAHYLRARGVGPDSLVGISLERRPELVVSLLAVWKAGGAYVPLDPTYPRERLAFMVKDAGINLLLVSASTSSQFAESAAKIVRLDADWPAMAGEQTDNLRPVATPLNLAYIIYTSGSTGTPKGAMIVHRGLVNYLWWAIEAYGAHAGSAVPVHSSISFDLTVTSLYPALLAGIAVDLIADDAGGQHLIDALKRMKDRSLVKITPAHLELLGRQLTADEAAGMTRVFVIGGENLPAETLKFWRDASPRTRLVNEYGPTETVVGCCVYEVRDEDSHHGAVPIGRPIANTHLYVLDEARQQVAAGAMGELYIGGAGVARGYLNRPELTAERFLVDPFSSEPGARMYKTGDLARWREDGVLEFLGRVDHQVKIRGYRIELGEVEAYVARHKAVRQVTVIAREDVPGERTLAAYIVTNGDSAGVEAGLRAELKASIPDYMVPSAFVFLDQLPLTTNGKVDRAALPAPSKPAAIDGREGVAPRTPTEALVLRVFCDVLDRTDLGVNDNFFENGGHSLSAARLISNLRKESGTDLPLRNLFEQPTPAGLATIIDGLAWVSTPVASTSGDAREELEF
jgi:amino acid adenylation domain-containing protein